MTPPRLSRRGGRCAAACAIRPAAPAVLRVIPTGTIGGRVDDGADDPRPAGVVLIDELVREGARRMLAEALQAEVDAYIARHRRARRQRAAAGGAQRRASAPGGAHLGRCGGGGRAAGQRPAHRPADGRTVPVLLGDPAALGTEDPEDHRGAAAAVPARAVLGGLRTRARAGDWIGPTAGHRLRRASMSRWR